MKPLLKILPVHDAFCFLRQASFVLKVLALKNDLMNKKGQSPVLCGLCKAHKGPQLNLR